MYGNVVKDCFVELAIDCFENQQRSELLKLQ